MKSLLWTLLLALLAISPASAEELASLDGDWLFSVDPPVFGATTVPVPHQLIHEGILDGDVWFETTFTVPAPMVANSSQFFIRFEQVNYQAEVFLNGTPLAFRDVDGSVKTVHTEPFASCDFLATSSLLTSGVNTLRVHVKTVEKVSIDTVREAQGASDVVIHPVGTDVLQRETRGITGSVHLVGRPDVFIENTWVRPSWSTTSLGAQVTVVNLGTSVFNGTVDVEVTDPLPGLPGVLPTMTAAVTGLAPGSGTKVNLSATWIDPDLWSWETPRLYDLQVELNDTSSLIESTTTSFGYSDFRVDGVDWKLNGKRVRLQSDTWLMGAYGGQPENWRLRSYWEDIISWTKASGLNCVRPGQGYQPELMLETCDELGLLINFRVQLTYLPSRIRFGATGDAIQYDIRNNSVLWENMRLHIRRVIRQLRNHPSLAVWSLENEVERLTELTGNAQVDLLNNLATFETAAGRLEDDTRPMHFDGDNALHEAGTQIVHSSIWSEHYHGGSTYNATLDFPNAKTDYEPWVSLMPTFHGEFIWAPKLIEQYRPAASILLGDHVYAQPTIAQNFGHAELIREEVRRNRFLPGLDGQQPFIIRTWPGDPRETRRQAARRAYRPLEILIEEASRMYHSDSMVTLHLRVDNVSYQQFDGDLEWSLLSGNALLDSGSSAQVVEAGEQTALTITFKLPHVSTPSVVDLRLSLFDGMGATQRSHVVPLSVRPLRKPFASYATSVGILDDDPNSATEQALAQLGLRATMFKKIPSSGIPSQFGVFVIAAGALDLANGKLESRNLKAFVENGGRVLSLEQDYMTDGPPIWLEHTPKIATDSSFPLPDPQTTSIAFTRAAGHPVLHGIDDEELRLWGANHILANQPLRKATEFGWLNLIESSSGDGATNGAIHERFVGLGNAPLIEARQGAGTNLICSLAVIEHFDEAPGARTLLTNMLQYLEQPAAHSAVVGFQGQQAQDYITRNFSLQPQADLNQQLTILDRSAFVALPTGTLLAMLNSGKNLLVRGLTPGDGPLLSSLVGTTVTVPVGTLGDDRLQLWRYGLALCGIDQQELASRIDHGDVFADPLSFSETPRAFKLAVLPDSPELAAVSLFAVGNGILVVDQTLDENPITAPEATFDRVAVALVSFLSHAEPLGANPTGDDDADGLNNLSERWAGLDPTSFAQLDAPLGDPDFDGLTNAQEFQLGSDPTSHDTDYDGLSDGLEVAQSRDWRLFPPTFDDLDGDFTWDNFDTDIDGDGFSNLTEALFGTNALNPLDTP